MGGSGGMLFGTGPRGLCELSDCNTCSIKKPDNNDWTQIPYINIGERKLVMNLNRMDFHEIITIDLICDENFCTPYHGILRGYSDNPNFNGLFIMGYVMRNIN